MQIKSANFALSSPDLKTCPESPLPEVAFIGRSNVGKSSMINLLTGKKDLAKVSATPGKTKLINFFRINDAWTLVDLPGYGYAKVAKSERADFSEAVAEYLAKRENLRLVFVLIDSRLTPQRIDLEFISWLVEQSVPFVFIFTKTDKLKAKALQQNISLFTESLATVCDGEPEILISSSKTGQGRKEILGFIEGFLSGQADGG